MKCSFSSHAQRGKTASRLVHTYSIVALDTQTGQLGITVQSRYLGVGTVVPWAEPGVGAVATQAEVDPSYGPLGLAMMRAGKSAPEALRSLLVSDSDAQLRQVAMVDAQGNVAVHTGAKCCQAAGHRTGPGCSAQANLVVSDRVWHAMAQAFESASGDLAERLMSALEAAEAEGGDIRGMQSAALLVVSGDSSEPAWGGRLFDLRVDDHPQPLRELRRLLTKARSFQLWNAAFDSLRDDSAGENRFELARREFERAVEIMPETAENPERLFRYAFELACAGKVEDSLPFFGKAFAANPRLRELVPRLVPIGLLPDDPRVVELIMDQAQ